MRGPAGRWDLGGEMERLALSARLRTLRFRRGDETKDRGSTHEGRTSYGTRGVVAHDGVIGEAYEEKKCLR